ncbi:DNA recombination protein RmuC [Kiritimatiella glycovorans]|uniref:DNA recombination protein RmuC n=1 Tax=Kiritimatiella glycovorans TaxID=1307763 RepID=A0A0G3EB89_9BACT|nr:DNA recombination protein RmuC [Kiritimatiella glycovorans]AKJ63761.1 DNA recombination protein RmuC [Kiritimatiella glycovorans]
MMHWSLFIGIGIGAAAGAAVMAAWAHGRLARLRDRLEFERSRSEEKLATLDEARESMAHQFENLANRIFEEKGQRLGTEQRERLDQLLAPLRQQITEFRKRVDDVHHEESRERASLKNQVQQLQECSREVGERAAHLTQALRGEVKTQGDWGEFILERILEESGLRRDEEYEVQTQYTDASGRRLRPDVVLHLPEEKDVVIDSKVSLKSYEQYCHADDEPTRGEALNAHLQSMRQHIRDLGQKKYEDLEAVRSLDFVLMFVPVEPAFITAAREDPSLYHEAFQRNILLVGPSTLMMTLRIIESIWRREKQSQNADAIASRAGSLYDKFVSFVESIEDVGQHLDRAKESHEQAVKRLQTGSGNVLRQIEMLRELGVRARKKLPPDWNAEEEDPADKAP